MSHSVYAFPARCAPVSIAVVSLRAMPSTRCNPQPLAPFILPYRSSRRRFLGFSSISLVHVEKLNVTGITYDGKSASQRLLIGLANTGTQMIHPAGSLQVTDKERRLLQNVPLKLAAILPQTAINYPVGIVSNALNSGPYRASVSLGYEGGHTTKYEASFVVPRPQPSTKQTLPKSATSQILPKPVTNQAIPRAVSDIATPYRSPAFFNILTPWYYIVGLLIIMLILAAMFPWSRRLYRPLARLRQRSK